MLGTRRTNLALRFRRSCAAFRWQAACTGPRMLTRTMLRARVRMILLSVMLGGCGGIAGTNVAINVDGGTDGTDGTGDTGAPHDAHAAPPAPTAHRPNGTPCAPTPIPPEPEIPDGGLSPSAHFDCHVHADCVAHPRGRCVFLPTNPPIEAGGTRCMYDACFQDGDCESGGSCACGGLANTCLPGNCRVDGDCGSGGFCSPSVDACGDHVAGYFCHVPADTCLDDRDCLGGPTSACVFDASESHWRCAPVGCESMH